MLVCRAAQFFSCIETALAFGFLTVFPGRELRPIPHSLHVWQPEKPPQSATCFLGNQLTSCRMVKTPKSKGPCARRNSVWLCVSKTENETRTSNRIFSCLKITTGKAASLCQAIKVPDFFCYIARHWVLSFLPWYPHFNGQMLERRWSEEGHPAFLWSVCFLCNYSHLTGQRLVTWSQVAKRKLGIQSFLWTAMDST